ncbi:MAG: ThiF family adenylyltransferase [Dehalococcoidia bacterium]|nr:ThiF family adenylyltransferase [Dehalococcoidia bacterium]
MDSRQEPALGDIHHRLGACDVTLVGAGGIGSPLAETLFRMGPKSLTVLDSGFFDTTSNVRRTFNARLEQVVEPYPPKAQIAVDACREIGLPNKALAVTADVRFAATLPRLLDTDIIICATDSHSSRAALTAVAYAFHIPLIDGGVRVGRGPRGLEGLAAEVRFHGPGIPCAWCTGTLDAAKVREENLPPEQRVELEREGYVVGSAEVEPSVGALTVLAAGLLACGMLGSLDDDADRLLVGYVVDGLMGDARSGHAERRQGCICSVYEGKAGNAPLGLR